MRHIVPLHGHGGEQLAWTRSALGYHSHMRGRLFGRTMVIAVAIAVSVAGCSRSEDFEPRPTGLASPWPSESAQPTLSPEAPPTESPTPSAPMLAPAARLFVFNPDDWNDAYTPEFAPLETANADGSVGSGCEPPSPDTLPDGIWKGLVHDSGSDWIDFDLVCSYNIYSERFLAWATEREAQGMPPEHELIRNNNPATRRVYFSTDAVASDANFHFETAPPDWSWEDIVAEANGSDYVWLWVNGGLITEIHLAYES